ncbi:hypothetical protein ACFLSJ_06060, partial [Verrucomicrobiota bacterium]
MFFSRLIGPVAVLLTIVATVVSWNMVGPMGAILPPLFLVCLILLDQPKKLLMFFWGTLLFVPTAEILLPSVFVKIYEQFFGIYLLAALMGSYVLSPRPFPGTRTVNHMLVALLALIGISAVVNRVPTKCVVFYLLTYVKHVWVFYYCIRYLEEEDGKTVFKVMLWSIGVQIPFNVAYYLGVNPLPRMIWRRFVDASIGTLGGSHQVGYFMTAGIVLLFAFLQHAPSIRAKIGAWLYLGVMFIQLYLTFTIHAYPLLMGALGVQYLLSSGRGFKRVTRFILAAFACLIIVVFVLSMGIITEATRIATVSYWQYSLERMLQGPKIEAYTHVFLRAAEHVRYPWLGGGPGNYTSNIAFITNRPMAQLPHLYYRYIAVDRWQVSMGGSILTMTRTGAISLFGELGPMGLALFWGLYAYAALRVWRQVRADRYRDPYRRVLAEAFVPVIAAFCLLNVISEAVVDMHLNLGLWIWAAAV